MSMLCNVRVALIGLMPRGEEDLTSQNISVVPAEFGPFGLLAMADRQHFYKSDHAKNPRTTIEGGTASLNRIDPVRFTTGS